MFFDPKAQAQRKAAQEAFEAKKIADLTVSEFRQLMAQVLADDERAQIRRQLGLDYANQQMEALGKPMQPLHYTSMPTSQR